MLLDEAPGNAIFYEIVIDLSLHAQGRLTHNVCHSNPIASLSILHNDSQYIFLYIHYKMWLTYCLQRTINSLFLISTVAWVR